MRTFLTFILLLMATVSWSQNKTVAEQLGYPADTKLLIIHADDLGVSHSENEASIAAMEKGSVSSASIMVPCPWFPEIAAYAVAHPKADLGLHLTLTAEWKNYKWGTVAARNEVGGLLNDRYFLADNVAEVATKASAAEVEKELRAQVERAKQFGIDVTHFDTHMGTLMATQEFAKVYIKLSHEYKVPILLHRGIAQGMLNMNLDDHITKNDVVMDNIYIASPDDYKKGMKSFYTGVLNAVKPGISCLLLHAAYDNAEMQAVTIDHPDYGAAWRQADYDFFTSEECKKILKDQKIQLVTWREIRDKITRK
jgi:chitin disaccharide deacetylase